MPCAQVKERTVGHIACLGDKLNGSVPQCQVGYDAHVAGESIPQKRVVVDSNIGSGINAGVEGSRAVKADCNVREDVNGDIDKMEFLVPNDCVIQDPLGLVLDKRCEVEHLGRVLQDTDPANCPVGSVNRDVDDVMERFRIGLVHHGHLSSEGSVPEGEVEDNVLLGCSVEEGEHEGVIHQNLRAVPDPMCDVDASDLIDFREHLSGEESVIQFRCPVAHREIEVQILGGCRVGVSCCKVEDCSVMVGAIDKYSS